MYKYFCRNFSVDKKRKYTLFRKVLCGQLIFCGAKKVAVIY